MGGLGFEGFRVLGVEGLRGTSAGTRRRGGGGWGGIPGRMPGVCVLHASVPVFPRHVRPGIRTGGGCAADGASRVEGLAFRSRLVEVGG